MTTTSPLLSVGTFGVHVIGNDKGYSFVGTVPRGCGPDFQRGGYKTEEEAIAAFVQWFQAQSLSFKRDHVSSLRNDVFALVLAG